MKKRKLCFACAMLASVLLLAACGGEIPPAPPSDSIPSAGISAPQGLSQPPQSSSTPAVSYHDALSGEDIAQAKKIAEQYYASATQSVQSLTHAEEAQYARFVESEASYQPGEVVLFVGPDSQSGALRGILLKRSGESWQVANEGF